MAKLNCGKTHGALGLAGDSVRHTYLAASQVDRLSALHNPLRDFANTGHQVRAGLLRREVRYHTGFQGQSEQVTGGVTPLMG